MFNGQSMQREIVEKMVGTLKIIYIKQFKITLEYSLIKKNLEYKNPIISQSAFPLQGQKNFTGLCQ